ncbi:hypothetical protein HN011_000661 [Eciton burchellii]|nr:hypothetical protein HN011_000661 [Eciton burchellii]
MCLLPSKQSAERSYVGVPSINVFGHWPTKLDQFRPQASSIICLLCRIATNAITAKCSRQYCSFVASDRDDLAKQERLVHPERLRRLKNNASNPSVSSRSFSETTAMPCGPKRKAFDRRRPSVSSRVTPLARGAKEAL